ncbi:MAG: cell wall-associated hydrolase, invasion-associated protein [Bacteroidetes bacterium]|nr:cell wall-associated hydrolase, invasion-associated protein [Bacteroidota bacterium]
MKKPYLYIILLISTLSISSCSLLKKPSNEETAWEIEFDNERDTSKPIKKEEVKIEDKTLAKYYESWLGTPHVMGGTTKKGVDCSGFVQNVYKDVYGIMLPRTAAEMEKALEPIESESSLNEGDLVFFKNKSKKVSHVGIYLKDNTFVHTSTSQGVVISSLNDKYWIKYYYRGGRHPKMKKMKSKR